MGQLLNRAVDALGPVERQFGALARVQFDAAGSNRMGFRPALVALEQIGVEPLRRDTLARKASPVTTEQPMEQFHWRFIASDRP